MRIPNTAKPLEGRKGSLRMRIPRVNETTVAARRTGAMTEMRASGSVMAVK